MQGDRTTLNGQRPFEALAVPFHQQDIARAGQCRGVATMGEIMRTGDVTVIGQQAIATLETGPVFRGSDARPVIGEAVTPAEMARGGDAWGQIGEMPHENHQVHARGKAGTQREKPMECVLHYKPRRSWSAPRFGAFSRPESDWAVYAATSITSALRCRGEGPAGVGRLLTWAYSRSFARASRIRPFTVPRGRPKLSAISTCV